MFFTEEVKHGHDNGMPLFCLMDRGGEGGYPDCHTEVTGGYIASIKTIYFKYHNIADNTYYDERVVSAIFTTYLFPSHDPRTHEPQQNHRLEIG